MRLAFLVVFVKVILFASSEAVSVKADVVSKLTKSSSKKYDSVWNKMLAKLIKSMTPKDYRLPEPKLPPKIYRFHPINPQNLG
ncbi:hypothetical protein PF005_g28379 [Phytophthora fragariae]|uniref:RxLR effector protein n=1 Tax=Phytophthora fragariae TaxID=53985 RepID=A0A6A3EX31_9STRA|nr:hypothetical protein PF003_g16832 [Phytophthora fragariae]KAE8934568.1 hypothetical protein PF009_g15457 [Phytophthora fragariae]KAE9103011.1 hypothetical protein PF007_g14538 [Phytophthora fragariae]KAE9140760.1 hypothetical protein PF006_g13446 [Phytophthora fragariae]KAE9168437.1 hypothetical protein PF005_g28379 [Phytophthora fragariae]